MAQDPQDFNLDKTSEVLGKPCAACKIKPRNPKRSYCNDCWSARVRDYRVANPEAARSTDLKKFFGITLEQYLALHEQQEGVCAICKQPETVMDSRTQRPRNLAVDHCHEIGAIRGLLCMACNQGLGNFREDVDKLLGAIKYLTERREGVLKVESATGRTRSKPYRGRQSKPVHLNSDDFLG